MVKSLNMLIGRRVKSLCLSKGAFAAIILLATMSPSRAFAADLSWQDLLAKGDTNIAEQSLPEAESYFRQAVAQVQKVAHTPQNMVTCLNRLANTLALENKTDVAATVYQRSLGILESTYGRNNPRELQTLLALGSIYEASGDHNSAMHLYQRTMDISESHMSAFDPSVSSDLQQHLSQIQRQLIPSGAKKQHSISALAEDPTLAASSRLLTGVDDHGRDLIPEQENSDQSLVADFHKDMLKAALEADNCDRSGAKSLLMEAQRFSGKM